jgi:hypothetical protein
MATDALRTEVSAIPASARLHRATTHSIWQDIERFVRPLSSLRLTVALFAMAIFLIFVGTLAQTSADVWVVLRGYFRAWFAWVPLQLFFNPAFFPDPPSVPGGFYFPGGFTIGTLMGINLLAAHGVRFKVQAKGARLWSGLATIAAGAALTWVVISTQQDSASLTGFTSSNWQTVWFLVMLLLAGVWGASAHRLFTVRTAPLWQRWTLSVVGIAAGGVFCWLAYLYLDADPLAAYEGHRRRAGDVGRLRTRLSQACGHRAVTCGHFADDGQ